MKRRLSRRPWVAPAVRPRRVRSRQVNPGQRESRRARSAWPTLSVGANESQKQVLAGRKVERDAKQKKFDELQKEHILKYGSEFRPQDQ